MYKDKNIGWVVRLPDSLRLMVKEQAKKTGKNQAEFIYSAVVAFIHNQQNPQHS